MRQINQVPDASSAGFYNPCEGALSIIMPQEAVNQVKNPSFELYLDAYGTPFPDWRVTRISTPGGVTSTISDISPYITTGGRVWSGANALYTANPAGFNFISLSYLNLSVVAGEIYAFSFYLFGAPGSSGRTYTITITSGAPTPIATKSVQIVEGQWRRFEVVFRAATTVGVSAIITKSQVGGSYAGGDAYIDALQFEQIIPADTTLDIIVSNMHATTYFDGDTIGTIDEASGVIEYAWRGVPHRSVSVRSGLTTSGGRIYNLQDEFGLEIIGIAEAGMSQPQVQAVTFNSQDGSALQDIINPTRVITLIGQVSGVDKIDLSRKLQRLTAILSRDVTPFRQNRRFVFQHLDGRDPVGVPMTFTGAFAGGMNVMAGNMLTVNVDISIQMGDPYFYGHDEAVGILGASVVTSEQAYLIPSYDTADMSQMMQQLSTGLDGEIRAMVMDEKGFLWIGGNFTQSLTGQSLPYICRYDPQTGTFSTVQGGTLNGEVRDIKMGRNGIMHIAGVFTGAMGNYYTQHYNGYLGQNFVNTGNFNNAVTTICIVPRSLSPTGDELVYVGGAFTTAPFGAANRIAVYSFLSGSWGGAGVGSGFNGAVWSIAYSPTQNQIFIGGQFTTLAGVACLRLAFYNLISTSSGQVSTGIANNSVRSLFVDADDTLVIGGNFTGTLNTLAYYRVGSPITQWPTGFLQNGFFTPISQIEWTNQIFACRGGIFVGASRYVQANPVNGFQVSLFPSACYWNGTVLSGSAWVPVGNTGYELYVGVELGDGQLYLGAASSGADFTSSVQQGLNSSTVQAYPIIRAAYKASEVQSYALLNVRDGKIMLFNDLLYQDLASVAYTDADFTIGEIITIYPKTSRVVSQSGTNFIREINPAGNFVDFTIRPGQVSLSWMQYEETNPLENDIVVYWPQTFQSIFDGVNRV
jgi:hypothetical protein